jgi:hypothetical protein
MQLPFYLVCRHGQYIPDRQTTRSFIQCMQPRRQMPRGVNAAVSIGGASLRMYMGIESMLSWSIACLINEIQLLLNEHNATVILDDAAG